MKIEVFGLLAAAVCNTLSMIFSYTGSTTSLNDSAVRIICGGITCVFLPGWTALKFFQYKDGTTPDHSPFWNIAISFIVSTIIGCFFALLCFYAQLEIKHWAIGIFLWNFVFLILATHKYIYQKGSIPRNDFTVRNVSVEFWIVCILSVLLYRHADHISQVGYEVALHLQYIRHYSAELPLSFEYSNMRPGVLNPGNHFFLWEFILAGVSQISGVDSTIAALRSRWIIPIVGLSSFYFLVRIALRSRRYALSIIALVIVVGATQFMIVAPHRWVGVIGSLFRSLTMFMGSIHHSDTAMEILLPLSLGILWLFYNKASLKRALAFLAFLIVSFFWHPREFFQVAWVSGVLMFTDLILIPRAGLKKFLVGRCLPLIVLLLCSAGLILSFNYLVTYKNIEQTEAMSSKSGHFQEIFRRAKSPTFFLEAQPPYSYQEHDLPEKVIAPYNTTFPWLLLSGAMALACLLLGNQSARRLSVFYFLLWFLTLCYVPTQYFLSAITYNEILISKSRFLFPFSLLIIGMGWIELLRFIGFQLGRRIRTPLPKLFFTLVVSLGIGLLLKYTYDFLVADYRPIQWLQWIAVLAALIAFRFSRPFASAMQRARLNRLVERPSQFALVITFLAVLAPISVSTIRQFWSTTIVEANPPIALYELNNPLGFAVDTIDFLRKEVAPRTYIQVEPATATMLALYAPVYVKPLAGNILKDAAENSMLAKDAHPVFNRLSKTGGLDTARAVEFLRQGKIQLIFVPPAYFEGWNKIVLANPEQFKVVFSSKQKNEMFVSLLP